eukprot:21437-Heterococcus_DN1.PRE.3
MSLSTDLMPEYCALVCSLTFTVSSGYTQQMPLTPPTVPAITSCAKVPCCIVPPCTQAHKDLCKRSDSYCTESITFAPSSCMQQAQRLESRLLQYVLVCIVQGTALCAYACCCVSKTLSFFAPTMLLSFPPLQNTAGTTQTHKECAHTIC